jgi:predicted helicase
VQELSYIEGITHRCMRQSLMDTFTDIYILDLHGSLMKKETAPDGSKDENVFDIQQGVAIGIFVKDSKTKKPTTVHFAEMWGLREYKYTQLMEIDLVTRRSLKSCLKNEI